MANDDIKVLTPDQLETEVSKILTKVEEPGDETEKKKTRSETLAMYVRERFDTSDRARSDIEQRWLQDLRQYRGQYEPEVLERIGDNRSKAFVRLTRTKVKTVDSRLTDFLFPANGEKNWGIEPTPLPEYTQEQLVELVQMHLNETGEQITPEALQLRVKESADAKAKKMSQVIEDQLIELKYRSILREVLHSGNLYGTGVLKGPMVSLTENKQYKKQQTEEGYSEWVMENIDTITPFIESVPLWDVYPDFTATKIEDCRYLIQRHKMTKHQMTELAKRSDFNSKKIYKYLKETAEGDFTRKTHEVELQSIGNLSDRSSDGEEIPGKTYEVLEFWGYVDSYDLERAGVSIPDKLKGQLELAACIWVVGNVVVKASLSPIDGVKWPYFFYYYDKDETSIFGDGIATIMRDVQELTNSSFRAMLDNAAISAGPQIEVNLDLLAEDEDPTDVHPFRVWTRTGEGADASYPAVRVFDLPSYANEFLKMSEAFERYGDEVTTIPRYMWGDQAEGAGRTASGLSMMMGSANITIKDQVKNFDDGITKPFLTAMYHWNMQFYDDDTVKGDYAIVAQGTSSLIAREVYANSLMQFANITNNPVDLPIVKREKIIAEIAESLDLGDKGLVLTDKEIEVNRQMQERQQRAERDFMTKMTEIARESGVSPTDMMDTMRSAQQDLMSGA